MEKGLNVRSGAGRIRVRLQPGLAAAAPGPIITLRIYSGLIKNRTVDRSSKIAPSFVVGIGLVQALVERLARDAEHGGGDRLVAGGAPQGLIHQQQLDLS